MTKPSGVLRAVLLALPILGLVPETGYADGRVQRFTLVVGANFGGAERPRLQYAVSDAERFARVLVELGGVSRANEIILRQPRLADLGEALDRLAARVAEARRTAGPNDGRTEVLLYYSGHADERGLLIGDDRYSYRTLRDRLDQIPADVRIAVLDACASGAFTRIKSGRARPAFIVDEASNMRGHAFLTSSAATEAAQESDRIRASYFTHYLLSGFRGAADLSGDGKVTLNEAYQFAFSETLGRTVDTKGGPQHPSYDINLSGTGDVVMTDLRQTTATLVLADDLDGRFFVRNAQKELIVELYKSRGRRVALGVEPGTYEIRLELPKASLLAKTEIGDGAQVVLESRQFGPVAVEATRRRGNEGPNLTVAGRNRIGVRWGQWRTSRALTESSDLNPFGGVEYARYLREDFSMALGVQGFTGVGGAHLPDQNTFLNSASMIALPVVVRWNPWAAGRENRALKPLLAAGAGPVFGWGRETVIDWNLPPAQRTPTVQNYRRRAASVHLGAGLDFHITRTFVLTASGGYNWMVRGFERPVGTNSTYSAPEFSFSAGWTFGRRRVQ